MMISDKTFAEYGKLTIRGEAIEYTVGITKSCGCDAENVWPGNTYTFCERTPAVRSCAVYLSATAR